MKRTLVVFAATMLAIGPAAAHAQHLGIKGGLSFSNVSNGGLLPGDNTDRTGFAAGLSLRSTGAIGIGVEGLYAQRGLTNNKLDYVDVPAYLRIAFPKIAIAPFVYAGPQASFEIKCEQNGGDCPSGHKKTTYAGTIGAGIQIGHNGGLSLEGRYVYGLTDLHLSTVTTSSNYKTRGFMLLAGLGF